MQTSGASWKQQYIHTQTHTYTASMHGAALLCGALLAAAHASDAASLRPRHAQDALSGTRIRRSMTNVKTVEPKGELSTKLTLTNAAPGAKNVVICMDAALSLCLDNSGSEFVSPVTQWDVLAVFEQDAEGKYGSSAPQIVACRVHKCRMYGSVASLCVCEIRSDLGVFARTSGLKLTIDHPAFFLSTGKLKRTEDSKCIQAKAMDGATWCVLREALTQSELTFCELTSLLAVSAGVRSVLTAVGGCDVRDFVDSAAHACGSYLDAHNRLHKAGTTARKQELLQCY